METITQRTLARYKATKPSFVHGTYRDASVAIPAIFELDPDVEPSLEWIALNQQAKDAKEKLKKERARPADERVREAEEKRLKAIEEEEDRILAANSGGESGREVAGGTAPPTSAFLPDAIEPREERHGRTPETNKGPQKKNDKSPV